jgi:O-antigen/teichoic acid export membrane protein
MISVSARATAWAVPISVELMALLRSVILARLLGAEEFGQATILALTLRLVEMVSDVGVERLLAQAPDGDSHKLQSALQGALVLRGVFMAVVLGALGVAMAAVFPDGPTAGTYLALALVPLIKAILHLDVRRAERRFQYRGLACVEGAGAVTMILVATAVADQTGTHIAIVFALGAQALVQVLVSHLLAERAYRCSFDPKMLKRIWLFGAPLIANAGLMFATLQADRLIIAKAYGWADLAVFAVVLQLSLLPALITGRASASLLVPLFRRAHAAGTLTDVARRSLFAHVILAIAFVLGFALLAQMLITLIYGAAFEPSQPLVLALAIAAALRIARTPLSQLSVSLGRTGDPARANLLRATALLPMLVLAALSAPLWTLAASAALGECFAALRGWQLLSDILETPLAEKALS